MKSFLLLSIAVRRSTLHHGRTRGRPFRIWRCRSFQHVPDAVFCFAQERIRHVEGRDYSSYVLFVPCFFHSSLSRLASVRRGFVLSLYRLRLDRDARARSLRCRLRRPGSTVTPRFTWSASISSPTRSTKIFVRLPTTWRCLSSSVRTSLWVLIIEYLIT